MADLVTLSAFLLAASLPPCSLTPVAEATPCITPGAPRTHWEDDVLRGRRWLSVEPLKWVLPGRRAAVLLLKHHPSGWYASFGVVGSHPLWLGRMQRPSLYLYVDGKRWSVESADHGTDYGDSIWSEWDLYALPEGAFAAMANGHDVRVGYGELTMRLAARQREALARAARLAVDER